MDPKDAKHNLRNMRLAKRARKLKDNFTFHDYSQNRNQLATRVVKLILKTADVKGIC